jgi:hypothetical protein
MYIFSANGKARKDLDDIKQGEEKPFIVYINFPDLFGAEQLCKIYLMKSGFTEIEIKKRKLMPDDVVYDERGLKADKAMADALKDGYHIQLFDAH